jgi:hypothetical protein
MDIVKAFTDTWDIYRKNFAVIILASIAVFIIYLLVFLTGLFLSHNLHIYVLFTGLLLFPTLILPLMTGLQLMFLKGSRGEAVLVTDLFAPFKRLPVVWLGGFLIGVLIFIGTCLLVLPGLFLAVIWMYVLLFICDKNMGVIAALRASQTTVMNNNFWQHGLLLASTGIITYLGNLLPFAGVILTLPLAVGVIACAYAETAK